MPFYIKKGSIPSKRHIQHKSAEGKLRYEEHISREGFSDIYSNVYHLFRDSMIITIRRFRLLTRIVMLKVMKSSTMYPVIL